MFHWLKDHHRKKILQNPFPPAFREILRGNFRHYTFLDDEEKKCLEELVQVFLAEKRFEGCNGLEITDEIRVVIAAEACMLLLGIPQHDLYRGHDSILVYPSVVVTPPASRGVFLQGPLLEQPPLPISGQAFQQGPVLLVWDVVKRDALHPERKHNVVYHEFAHLLDMENGAVNGTPELHSREQYRTWAKIFSEEFLALRRDADRGRKTFLDPYGAVNEGEFFAVATEFFFDRPIQMQSGHRALYEVLAGFYQQDPAAREHRYRKIRHTP